MRFLVVPQDRAKESRDLLERLAVSDIQLVLVKKREDAPSAEDERLFRAHPQAPAALVSVKRDYAKAVRKLLSIECERKEFRAEDQLLVAWLKPTPPVVDEPPDPRTAMTAAEATCDRLHFAKHALVAVDEIPPHRHGFIARAAQLLIRFANGEDLGPFKEWKERHWVHFAGGGKVSHQFHYMSEGKSTSFLSDWHLKEGDFTSPESAARVYFGRAERDGRMDVFVAYVGPHPKDGKRYAYFYDVPEK